MIGKTVSHYEILEHIGEGGMGVVYKALDTTLDRHVAIKFLPPHLSFDAGAKKRFVHEAKAASALNHSNIAVIHEIDETPEGQMFIVMAYYEGQTLKDKLSDGALSVDEAVMIVVQIASGLAKAHEKEIMHRDIKPANILLTEDGEVKLADFGLAKLAGRTQITKSGITVGTVSYMSPEQASGRDTDHRSDLFSLGVVLYELLTGQLPFKGDHEAAVLYGILNNDPDPVSSHDAQLSGALQSVVDRAMSKDPASRYQSAGEMAADLKRLTKTESRSSHGTVGSRPVWRRFLPVTAVTVAVIVIGYFAYSSYVVTDRSDSPHSRKMIVVLPFENLGPPEDKYFADGITEEITARLARIVELGVIARTSAIQYVNTDKTIQEIGEELGVDFIMEGTIRWQQSSGEPSRIRVTPQLIRVSDATHVWAEIYDEPMTKIFSVQSSIARKVIEAIDVTLIDRERNAADSGPTDDLDAYQAYLRGMDHLRRASISREQLEVAERMFSRAIELDPGFAVAYSELSMVHTDMFIYHERTEERLALAKTALDQALSLEPGLAEAHLAHGYYYQGGHHDYTKALEEFTIAQNSSPNNYSVLEAIGVLYKITGEFEKSDSILFACFRIESTGGVTAH